MTTPVANVMARDEGQGLELVFYDSIAVDRGVLYIVRIRIVLNSLVE